MHTVIGNMVPFDVLCPPLHGKEINRAISK